MVAPRASPRRPDDDSMTSEGVNMLMCLFFCPYLDLHYFLLIGGDKRTPCCRGEGALWFWMIECLGTGYDFFFDSLIVVTAFYSPFFFYWTKIPPCIRRRPKRYLPWTAEKLLRYLRYVFSYFFLLYTSSV